MKDNSKYKKQKYVEVKTKSAAGVEYTKYKPTYYEVTKGEFKKKAN